MSVPVFQSTELRVQSSEKNAGILLNQGIRLLFSPVLPSTRFAGQLPLGGRHMVKLYALQAPSQRELAGRQDRLREFTWTGLNSNEIRRISTTTAP